MSTPPDDDEAEVEASRGRGGDSGASLVEYSLLLALIVVACIAAVTFLGNSLDSSLSSSTSQFIGTGP